MILLLAAGATLYLAACVALFLGQGRLVYLPHPGEQRTPAQLGLDYRALWLTARDGVRSHAWWLPASATEAPVALFLHGNAGNLSMWLDVAADLRGLGWSVLIPDYRGYGLSEGTPTEEGTYLDALAAHRSLTDDLGIDPRRIVIIGRSLGGAVASWLAARETCGAVVLEATFTSVPDVAARLYPLFPVRALARIHYDTHARMRQLRCPALLVHARGDELVPYSQALRLRDGGHDVPLLTLEGGHNDAFDRSRETYRAGLVRFVDRALSGTQEAQNQ